MNAQPYPGIFNQGGFSGASFDQALGSDGGALFQDAVNKARSGSSNQTGEFERIMEKFLDEGRLQRTSDIMLNQQKQQLAEAAKYKALFQLPAKITEAMILPNQIRAAGTIGAANILAKSGQNIGQIYAQGLKPMQVDVPTVNYGFMS